MSLQFILGGSGSGKTRLLYENLIKRSIEEPDRQYIAIVPEQFSMQTQKELVNLHPRHGVMNIDIVSFQRLAYRVFEELGIVNPDILDDMGKSMVLRKVVSAQKNELELFKRHLHQNGFIDQLKSMLSELYQYGIAPDQLDMALPEDAGPVLKQKLSDLSIIYKGFKADQRDQFITAEEVLLILWRELPRSEMIRNSVITLDGFTGLTPIQYRLAEQFLQYSRGVTVAVTVDPEDHPYQEGASQGLFHMSRQMISRLIDCSSRAGAGRGQDILLSGRPGVRFVGSCQSEDGNALDFLEQTIFRHSRRVFTGPQDQITVCQSMNPSEEIKRVIGQIHDLVQTKGMRYRDIALITGDLGGYANEVTHQFEREGIPYFLDDKKSILLSPMVELIRSALEVIQKNFTYESVFRYLKTGLVSEDLEERDRLENYVVAMGIRGFKRWDSTWEWLQRGARDINLEQLNRFREEILAPLRRLRDAIKQENTTIRTMTEALMLLLAECRVEEKLKELKLHFEELGEHSLAKEYSQVYGLVLDMFDRIVRLLGDTSVTGKEYAEILDAGFQEIKVGMIPATVDRIVVGDIVRTRLDHIKALFFVGVNDGIVPAKKENTSLLTDRERILLSRNKVELAPTAREENFMQRFYLYLLITKPGERLILSYASMSAAGKSLRPSSLIREVQNLFPELKVSYSEEEDRVHSVKDAKERLIAGLRDSAELGTDEKFLEIYRSFYRSGRYKKEVEKLVDAAFYSYRKRGIGKAAASALYGNVLEGSVTRLEKYAACAYAHFLNYGLELKERKEFELAAMDIGNLFHNSIDLCFKTMKEHGGRWAELTEENRKDLVSYCVGKVTEEYGDTILKSSARNMYLAGRVERITDRTVWALAEQMKKGDFEPAGFELEFSAADNLDALKIPLSADEALHLRGRIDRMDLYEDENQVYIKIIDYKSGGTVFDLAALYYGLQLQLVVYMDAVIELEERTHPGKKIVPAGIFYYNINDPVVEKQGSQDEEEINRQILKTLKMNGLVNSELEVIRHLDREIEKESEVIPVAIKDGIIQEAKSSVAGEKRFKALRRYVKEMLKTQGRQILDGAAQVNPCKQGIKTACDYCPYHAVCGFDLKTSGYSFRRLKALKSEEIWPEIETAKEEGDQTDED